MMNRFKNAMYRFMYGRYGVDQLNWFLLIIAILISITNSLFIKISYLTWFTFIFYIIALFRMYSRNIYKRRSENNKFLKFFKPITRRVNLAKKNKADTTHKYYACPSCKQSIRVPKGKGKIEITCPKCSNKFTKTT